LNQAFEYTGKDNLETMGVAVNYNDHLAFLIKRELPAESGRPTSILDFGAGLGMACDLLRQDHIKTDCLEPDDKLRAGLASRGYTVFGDMSEIAESSYDVIYCLNVLEHIEDDQFAVKQLSSTLRPGGKLIVYVPAFQILFSSRDRKVGHHRRYRAPRLRELASSSALEIDRLEYCDPAGFLAAVAYRLGDHGDGRLSEARVRFFDRYLFPPSKVLQPLFRRIVGKNVLLVAIRPFDSKS
jgi:SAM-dependent methyltransferase